MVSFRWLTVILSLIKSSESIESDEIDTNVERINEMVDRKWPHVTLDHRCKWGITNPEVSVWLRFHRPHLPPECGCCGRTCSLLSPLQLWKIEILRKIMNKRRLNWIEGNHPTLKKLSNLRKVYLNQKL